MSLSALPERIKAAWGWYDRDDWEAQFRQLRDSGHNMMLRKAGIDDLGDGQPARWRQWSKARNNTLREYGIEPVMFVFSWLGKQFGWDAENNAILQLCKADLPGRIVLNFETQVDGMADSEATGYIKSLRSLLTATWGGEAPYLDNSSVPSWDGGNFGGSPYHNVPYEAVSSVTEIDWYQNYWDATDVGPAGYDWQDGFQRKRGASGPNKLVIPSWIVGKDPLAFADWANTRGYVGICGWECGNAGYDFMQVAQAWPYLQNNLHRLSAPNAWSAVNASLWNEYTNVKLLVPSVIGLPLYEGRLDLSQVAPGLPAEAAYLKTEKSTLWAAPGLPVSYMHDGQFRDIERANLATGRLAVRYGTGADKLPPARG